MAKIEVGRMALRAPDGSFLPSVPIYRDIPDELVTVTTSTGEGGEPETFICEFGNSMIRNFTKDIYNLKLKKRRRKK